jgi:hypothetical protein
MLMSKVGKKVGDNDTIKGCLEQGDYIIGGGATTTNLEAQGFDVTKLALGMNGVINDSTLGMHDRKIAEINGGDDRAWLKQWGYYSSMVMYGCVIGIGAIENMKVRAECGVVCGVCASLSSLVVPRGMICATPSRCASPPPPAPNWLQSSHTCGWNLPPRHLLTSRLISVFGGGEFPSSSPCRSGVPPKPVWMRSKRSKKGGCLHSSKDI